MTTFLIIGLCFLLALQLIGTLATISMVGKTRKPLTGGVASASTVISGFTITVLVLALIFVIQS